MEAIAPSPFLWISKAGYTACFAGPETASTGWKRPERVALALPEGMIHLPRQSGVLSCQIPEMIPDPDLMPM
jgi:hypothetical protein